MSGLLAEFLAQAERTPHAPALVVGERQLSYRELAQASASLAGRLVAAGARPGSVVGIRLPQSVETFVAMLAVWQAGCTWAVLEPTQPEGRLAALLADTDCRVLLHQAADTAALRSLLAGLPAPARHRPVLMAVDAPDAPDHPIAPVPVPEGLPVYVIYTSGSTGRPKGVLVTREQLAVSVQGRGWIYGLEPPIFLDTLRFSFDGSLGAAFWAIIRGGTLVVPAEEQLRDPAAVVELAGRHYVTHLIGVPSFYRLLLAYAERLPIELRLAAVGGEPCTPELVALHRSRLPAVELINEYGPTEAVVSCTAHRVQAVPTRAAPIGRPHPERWSGCWTRSYVRSRSAWSANSTWVGTSPPWDTSTSRRVPPNGSWPTRTRTGPAPGSTAPVTWRPGTPTGNWSSTAGSMTSSRCGGTGSSRGRSRGYWSDIRRSSARRCCR